ncbi:MAG: phosphatase PAP2 family protein [Clostridia bacterium]|nr:phosphatase PAP2 family protein [Clostridia bacterium]
MQILRFLEGIRTPFGDIVFSLITQFGEEMLFILLGLIFFWCVNKREGYYLFAVGFVGTVANQFLKLIFRIPRPWVRDSEFTIVEAAREEATGYSFPSGHTQSSVGVFGGIARWNKQAWLRIICIALCVLVPISRMYLGVHTPLDVIVSVAIALILIFGIYPIMHKVCESNKAIRMVFALMTLFSLSYLLFVSLYNFPADIDASNLENGTKNAYKMLGCTLGIVFTFEIDTRFIKFETKATLPAQILKLVIGLLPILAIKSGLKAPLAQVFGTFPADGIRYFLIVIFAGCIWPLTFKFFSKLFRKKVDN